ncbi:MAG: hypothetical protein JST00_27075 [Deltaproteobacteria bacterium]|nr:hypothetical protein [Deltaproteobacteria bacterium]
MTRNRLVGIALVAASMVLGGGAFAQKTPEGGAPKAADAGGAKPIEAGAAIPPGHPAMPADDDDPSANPHAGGGDPHAGGGRPGMQEQAPEDGSLEDPTLPKGSIEIHINDPAGNPLPKTDVTLGVIYNSVAKGESRKRLVKQTDALGKVRFEELDSGSGVAYRVMVMKDDATFSATPFQLGAKSGMRVILHVYPVTNDISQTLVVSQLMMYTEVKDDRVQVQQALKIYNFGRNAWVPPKDFVIALPPEFTAFTTQQGMTDVSVEAVPKQGIRLKGTFTPGQHVVEFRWQLPYAGEPEVKFDIGVMPNLAASRIIAPASKGMTLDVTGFDPPRTSTDGMGQRALVAERQWRREDAPPKSIPIALRGLPTEGPGKVIATFLSLCGIVAGVVIGSRKPPPRDSKGERAQLLESLEALEAGHREGSIGPKTYERARRELIDGIARTFAEEKTSRAASRAGRKSSR